MATSNQLTVGMTLSVGERIFRVESCVKVAVSKGAPFIKCKLRDLTTEEIVDKNFKLNQPIKDVSLTERKLEFLYPEGNGYIFLDVVNLELVPVPSRTLSNNIHFLKEGVELKAFFYGETIFSIVLPQFLELMVSKIDMQEDDEQDGSRIRWATLETGAKIEVPQFIEVGDIIKVDTELEQYIQRV